MTASVTVQLPAAGIVRPVSVIRPVWPLMKLLPAAPLQVPPAAWLPEMLMLVSVSVKVALV